MATRGADPALDYPNAFAAGLLKAGLRGRRTRSTDQPSGRGRSLLWMVSTGLHITQGPKVGLIQLDASRKLYAVGPTLENRNEIVAATVIIVREKEPGNHPRGWVGLCDEFADGMFPG